MKTKIKPLIIVRSIPYALMAVAVFFAVNLAARAATVPFFLDNSAHPEKC